jgi:hypothetical protein
MDKETIQQIAAEVVARLPFGDSYWLFLLVMVLVSALVGAFAALGASYFRTRGQNLATKHDFNDLLKQQEKTAEAVETIKSEISQRDWAQREWTNLRRIKLEVLLEKLHECETYLDRHTGRFLGGESLDHEEGDPANALLALGDLYFPELKDESGRYYIHWKELIVLGLKHSKTVLSAKQDVLTAKQGADLPSHQVAHKSAMDALSREWNASRAILNVDRSKLVAAARSLLERIMNVDEKYAPP